MSMGDVGEKVEGGLFGEKSSVSLSTSFIACVCGGGGGVCLFVHESG